MARHARRLTGVGKWHPGWLYRRSLVITVTLVVLVAGGGYALSSHLFAWTSSTPPGPKTSAITTSPSSPSSPSSPKISPATVPLARLCGQAGWPEKAVEDGAYIIQNDEWNSTAPECITADGGSQFTVASSSIYEPAAGDPGGYPAIYSGCSAGVCTTGSKLPIQVSDLGPGTITSSWATTQPFRGAYDVAYDIWFNRTPATSGAPDGGELMIWLAHRGSSQIRPSGSPVAQVTIGGYAFTVWVWHGNVGGGTLAYQVSYVMNRPVTSVRDLDIGAISADAAHRGYVAESSYLLNIQAGFEIWQGSDGLKTNSFAVNIGR
jgi:hypothetical protein